MGFPKVMLAGPFNECWDSVESALKGKQRTGKFQLEAWDIEEHRGSTETIRKWREKTKDVDAIVFLFGQRKDNGYGPVNGGTIIYSGQAIGGEVAAYDTTATEQEFLHSFLRPVAHKFLIPSKLEIHDPILKRMIRWGSEALGTLPTKYRNCDDAARQTCDFIMASLRDIKKRSRSKIKLIQRLGHVDEHNLGLKDPRKTLAGAPYIIRVALRELANSFEARRGATSQMVQVARQAVGRSVSLSLKSPGAKELGAEDFFDQLATWANEGPSSDGLASAPNFLECFYTSLSTWERTVLLIAATEAGLIHRYHRNHAKELRLHEIIIAGGSELRRLSVGASTKSSQVHTWAVARWIEVFAAGAVYTGHPEVIKSALRADWEADLFDTMRQVDEWGILSEASGNWKLRWYQLIGVARASQGEAYWDNARNSLDQAIGLARSTGGKQLVHSLLFKLWVTKAPKERTALQSEIDSLSMDRNLGPDSYRRLLYTQHRNSFWPEVFPSSEVAPVARKNRIPS